MRALLFLLCFASALCARQANDRPPLSLRVNHSISWGVDSLWQAQSKGGLWLGSEHRFPGGLTAFTCFALLKSGVPRSDADIQLAIRKLAAIKPQSTYGAAARLFLYSALGSGGAQRSSIEESANFLLAKQREGLWGYPRDPLDMSNTQFALLGLKAAADLGVEMPQAPFIRCLKAMLDLQVSSGAFRYKMDMLPNQGMTAATLAGFAILDSFSEDMPKLKLALKKREGARKKADTWMIEHFDPAKNAMENNRWSPTFRFATLWAIERYADLRGDRLIGEHDWYSEGAEWLMGVQNVDGSWGQTTYQTCFALLFLRRSTFSGPQTTELFEELDRRFQPKPKLHKKLKSNVPYLDQWVIAGPWRGTMEETGLFKPPFNPAKVRAKTGRKVGRKRFSPAQLEANSISDLERIVNPPSDDPRRADEWRPGNHQLFAIATYLVRDAPKGAEPIPAKLWFALEDGWRIFVDGVEVSRGDQVSAPLPIKEDLVIDIKLKPGHTSVLVLVEDVYGPVFFSCRLSDPLGKPLPDVEAITPR